MHRRSQSGALAHHHHHASSRPHSPAPTNGSSPSLDTLVPAATSSGTITVTATIVPDWQRKPREYINVALRKQMRKYGAVRDSGYWNKLLIAARKQRGPYFCPSTRMYHVDQMSKLFWTGYNGKENEGEKKDTPVKAESMTPQPTTNPLGSPPHVSAASEMSHTAMMNGMQPPNMLASGGFISPSSLMQAPPMMSSDSNNVAAQQAYYMGQINPQMLQKQQQQQQQQQMLLQQQQQQLKNRTR
ncbi:hypothetical protein BGZ73_003933 [Actinomortierella ambigua]|nr:hypothetical protein BGZ73_003933 [Actinomortierella ambigua]